jgi:hypothetical protein
VHSNSPLEIAAMIRKDRILLGGECWLQVPASAEAANQTLPAAAAAVIDRQSDLTRDFWLRWSIGSAATLDHSRK